MQRYDFKEVAQIALGQSLPLVSTWLPAGRKINSEWQCGSLNGEEGSSFSVNLKTGIWSDFATGEKGGDLVSLYAAIYTNNNQGKAVKELAEQLRINPVLTNAIEKTANIESSKSPWVPVLPVPENASPAPVAHIKRGRPDASWVYKDQQGRVLGYVHRFTKSDGSKEIAPLVYARDSSSTSGDRFAWRWMHFPAPRPLYALEHFGNEKPVLIVEGEKCVEAARGQPEIIDKFDVVSWSGGSNAVAKADWGPIHGRNVLIWPDTDSIQNREKTGFLPFEKQPGMKAALQIEEVLTAQACKVSFIKIEQPGIVKPGWDIADAIAEGLTGKRLVEWMVKRKIDKTGLIGQLENTKSEQPAQNDTAPAKAAKGGKAPSRAPAEGWYNLLLQDERYRYEDCRENIAICIENHPALKGCLAFNDFTARVMRVKPTPWNAEVGEWTDNDDLELSNFLAQNGPVIFKSLANIGHAVQMVAYRNKFHPLQNYLSSLEWDGMDRTSTWLTDLLGVPDSDYSRLVGKLWLRQAVSRAMKPGSKADYVLILEGSQGIQKSSALRALGGEYFSDAPLDLNSKDVYQAINGVWIYEIAELDAFNRTEATRIKAFITQPVDRYRLPYEKRMIDQRRHVVFAGTTNNYEYHKDTTGNRRFWSVRCSKIQLDALRQIRGQLFAQALHEVRAGEPIYPTREQELNLIQPEQEMREIVDAWQQIIERWLEEPDNRRKERVTVSEILHNAIGMDSARINPTRQSETKVGSIMHKLGWIKKRETSGKQRSYYYQRPARQERAA